MTKIKTERKVIVCDEYDFSWSKEQTKIIVQMHREGKSIQRIANRYRRPREEILIALIGLLPQSDIAAMLGSHWGAMPGGQKKFECID